MSSLLADIHPLRATDHGPLCECDLVDCMQHLPAGAWDDIQHRRPGLPRIFVVLSAHITDERVIGFRNGWALVEAGARAA